MLTPYRQLFGTPGTLAFSAAGFAPRLALSMSGISTILMVATLRDSYTLAGAVAGASLAATLVTLPWISRLVDRYGQSRVAVPTAVWSAVMSAALVGCLHLHAPTWTLFLASIASATAPNVGGMARARWAAIHRDDPDAMHVANSFEQVLDELCFILGPLLAVALCVGYFPEAGRLVAMVLTVVGTLAFIAQRRTAPVVEPIAAINPRSPLRDRGLQIMMIVFGFTGAVFGSLELATITVTNASGHGSAAGALLALQAVGSALAGMLYGLFTPRGTSTTRFVVGVGAMALFMVPLSITNGVGSLAALMFLAGMATSPTMITGMGLVQELVPRGQINEAMTLVVTSLLGGISVGGMAAGWTAEHLGPQAAYGLPVLAGLLALTTALLGRPRLRQHVSPDQLADTQMPAMPSSSGTQIYADRTHP